MLISLVIRPAPCTVLLNIKWTIYIKNFTLVDGEIHGKEMAASAIGKLHAWLFVQAPADYLI